MKALHAHKMLDPSINSRIDRWSGSIWRSISNFLVHWVETLLKKGL
jgi:hypothetical protein